MFDFCLLSLIHANFAYFVRFFAYKNEGAERQVPGRNGEEVDAVPSGKTLEPKGTDQKQIQPSVQEKPGEIMGIFAFVFSKAV